VPGTLYFQKKMSKVDGFMKNKNNMMHPICFANNYYEDYSITKYHYGKF